MDVLSYASFGFEGEVVCVEVDIRRGIPGVDLVGLPDNAVKEAKERVRVSIKNSGYQFPRDRVLVNLAPAGLKKEGASFDLAIAMAVLQAEKSRDPEAGHQGCKSNHAQPRKKDDDKIMILGELQLSGIVRPVPGVLPAVAGGLRRSIRYYIVPEENLPEARALEEGVVYGIKTLKEAYAILSRISQGRIPPQPEAAISNRPLETSTSEELDFSDIKGQRVLKRALTVAAAGMHNVLLFGPPGSGKTMSALRMPSILPNLQNEDSLVLTQIYSLAGLLSSNDGLLRRPPFRSPHHSASQEGIIGGGKVIKPGEVSLAHKGILFLDEATEFKKNLLQSLREPIERGKVDIARAGQKCWYPAHFQLIMAANPCPCGNLGKEGATCYCSTLEVQRYWRRMGGAILDRIDIRVPVKPTLPREMLDDHSETSGQLREKVDRAIGIQDARFKEKSFKRNSRIPPGLLHEYCAIGQKTKELFIKAMNKLSLSSRASHSVLKLSRTIADLEGEKQISATHLLEAVQHRRYGDSDFLWL